MNFQEHEPDKRQHPKRRPERPAQNKAQHHIGAACNQTGDC